MVAASALVATTLSALYVELVLRGGPRIVDATTYLLEARALSHGWLAWEPADPAASVAGRFLVRDALADGTRVAGIFPPGWPLLLAPFVAAGVPMAAGPLLAAIATVATAWLAGEVVGALRASPAGAAPWASSLDAVPPAAAALSAVCACLRHHTADTMSHGLSAALLAVALAAALRARRDPRVVIRVVVGLALGWLIATRPVSGLAVAAIVAAIAPRSPRDLAWMAAATVPGVALLVLHQRAATGAWMTSSQWLYYLLSDGPPGCFRYGFGAGIGCQHEHGEFVAANLPDGYGALEAVKTTGRRLKAHLVDPLNLEPLLALVVIGGAAVRRSRVAFACALAPLALLAAYAPFYFDGNYPGGGARFLADALPVEHVLAVVGALAVASRLRAPLARRGPVVAGTLVALAILGLALRAPSDHLLLRDREGGRPMYEPHRVRAAGIERGLMFVDTDHGFAIGHDPAVRAADGVEVLRRRGDAIDHLAWEARGRPPTFRYTLSTLSDREHAEVAITPFEPPPSRRIEAESLWPLAAARAASAWPRWAHGACASAGRRLGVDIDGAGGAIEVDLPRNLGAPGTSLVVHLGRDPGLALHAALVADGEVAAETSLPAHPAPPACEVLSLLAAPSPAGRSLRLRLSATPTDPAAPAGGRPARDLPGARRASGAAPPTLALDAIDLVVAD